MTSDMTSLRIVDVTDFYSERGGVRAHLELKGQVLCQLGHAHTVVAPGPRDMDDTRTAGPEDEPSQPGSRRVVRLKGPTLPYDSNYHLMWRVQETREIVARSRPHVIEVNSPYLAAWAMRKVQPEFGNIKTFWWHTDFIDTYARHFTYDARAMGAPRGASAVGPSIVDRITRPAWALVRSMLRPYAAVFCASREQADKLRSHGVERVICLPFGVDKRTFRPDRRSEMFRHEVLGRAGLGGPATIVAAVGRFAVEKHWDVVLDAFIRFRERHRAVLVAFGDGPERARLAAKVGHRTDIQFMGFERDKERLATALASSDIFLHACPFETFGLGVAQAIACGLPLVVPDQGGAAEQVDESFSERFRSGDAGAGAAAIERLQARDPLSTRACARRAAERVADVRDQVRRTIDIYFELLQKAPTRKADHARSHLAS
jgi:alpha-1,6-mannosyltransferase